MEDKQQTKPWTRRRLNIFLKAQQFSKAELGRRLGVSREFVRQWTVEQSPIPAKYWPQLDELSAQLLPIVWTSELLRDLRSYFRWSVTDAARTMSINRAHYSEMELGLVPITGKMGRRLEPFRRARIRQEILDEYKNIQE